MNKKVKDNLCPLHGSLSPTGINKNGLCKRCCSEYQKAWRNKPENRQKILERERAARIKKLENPVTSMMCLNCGPISGSNIDKWGRCISCRRRYNTKCYSENKNKWPSRTIEAIQKRYNKDRQKIYTERHKEKNKERIKELRVAKGRRHVASMADCYVKMNMARKYGLERRSIPPELVELERSIIKIKRAIKGRWKDPEYRRQQRLVSKALGKKV